MAFNSPSGAVGGGHIPAWKRLGLKLKGQETNNGVNTTAGGDSHASNHNNHSRDSINGLESSAQVHSPTPQQASEKRKRHLETTVEPNHPAKKRKDSKPDDSSRKVKKPSKSQADKDPQSLHASTDPSSDLTQEHPHLQSTTKDSSRSTKKNRKRKTPPTEPETPKSISPRKSVTFSEDTKAADGSSAQRFFKQWASSRQTEEGTVDSKNLAEVESSAKLAETSALSKQERQALKKAKKAERRKKATNDATQDQPAYLRYLTTFAHDRPSWKFNKSQQTLVLKNALNLYRIPEDMEEALQAYIAGLQSNGAIDRLRTSAEEVLREANAAQDLGSLNDPATRKAAQDAALAKHVIAARRHRAERFLETLGPAPEPQIVPSNDSQQAKTDDTKPKKRNRKRRTDVADSDSSSSSSDNDSESSAVSSSSEEPSSDSGSDSDSDSDVGMGDIEEMFASIPAQKKKDAPTANAGLIVTTQSAPPKPYVTTTAVQSPPKAILRSPISRPSPTKPVTNDSSDSDSESDSESNSDSDDSDSSEDSSDPEPSDSDSEGESDPEPDPEDEDRWKKPKPKTAAEEEAEDQMMDDILEDQAYGIAERGAWGGRARY